MPRRHLNVWFQSLGDHVLRIENLALVIPHLNGQINICDGITCPKAQFEVIPKLVHVAGNQHRVPLGKTSEAQFCFDGAPNQFDDIVF